MHRLTATALAAATAALLLTACSSADNTSDRPAAPTTTTASASPTPDAQAAKAACVEAVRTAVKDVAEGADLTKPAECATLSDGDYLDAYMDGLQKSNQDGRDDLQRRIDEAASADTPTP